MTDYKKYIKIHDDVKERDKIDEHYIYCNKNRLPQIIVCETGIYAEIKVDYITMSPEIDKYVEVVNEKFEPWVDDAIKNNLVKVGGHNISGICPHMIVKKQCADHYAEAAFDIYMDFWKSYERLIL